MPFHSIVWSQGATTYLSSLMSCHELASFASGNCGFLVKAWYLDVCFSNIFKYLSCAASWKWLCLVGKSSAWPFSHCKWGVQRAWNLLRCHFYQVGIYKVTSNRNHVWPQIQETHRIAIIRANNINNNQRIHHILIIFSFLIQHLQYFTMELLATMAFEIVSFCRSHCSFLRGCPAGYFGYLWICSAFMAKGPSKPSFREWELQKASETLTNSPINPHCHTQFRTHIFTTRLLPKRSS